MSKNSDFVTEQAIVAIFGVLHDMDIDVKSVAKKAEANILDSSSNYQVHGDHEIIVKACEEIQKAAESF
jgi:hypothetical protein